MLDLTRKQLIEAKTLINKKGSEDTFSISESINVIDPHSIIRTLLKEFLSIITEFSQKGLYKHHTRHYIETSGPPIFSKLRRLSSVKTKVAKNVFELMIEKGLCRISESLGKSLAYGS